MSAAQALKRESPVKNLLFISSALLVVSLNAGCGDDTATPFVFDAGGKDAAAADAGKDGSSRDASPDTAKDGTPTAHGGPETDVDADDSGAEASPE